MCESKQVKLATYRSLDYWGERWSEGKTGWHIDAPHPQLVDNAHLLLPKPDKYRVLIPLCGKSHDLIWLYKEGHTVVGVEGIEDVVKEFGEEHNLTLQVSTVDWGKLYETRDHRLQIYVCDFFKFPPHKVDKFDAVFDRGALIAINIEDREKYASMMKQMLSPTFRYLVSTLDYIPTEEFSGPPCAVPNEEIEKLFGDTMSWKILNSVDLGSDNKFSSLGIGKITENYVFLEPKAENS